MDRSLEISATTRRRWLVLGLSAPTVAMLPGCGYNDFQRLDEEVRAAWAEVLNQYQRRADLVPNLVATVQGEANFERETLTRVIEARARATAIQVTPEMLQDAQAMQRYNTLARSFPTNLTARVFGYEPKPSFAPPNEAGLATPPKVEFPAPSR